MRTIIWLIYCVLYLTVVFPLNLYVGSKIKRGKQNEVYPYVERVVQNWARRLLDLAGVQVTVEGEENIPEGAALFVGNHQGDFDIPICLCRMGRLKTMVAKKELEKIPGIRSWMSFFDCIFMDRDDPRQSLRCLNDAQKLLEQGRSVVIFPEGTRSRGPAIGEFKPGALRCALKAKVPIVPFAIDGSYKVLEAHGIWIHPAHVRVTILPPVPTADMEKEHTKTISDDIRAMIGQALEISMQKEE